MEHTIFYSWQSDVSFKSNRNFIETCLEESIKRANKDIATQYNLSNDIF
jgi:hypothetical protein